MEIIIKNQVILIDEEDFERVSKHGWSIQRNRPRSSSKFRLYVKATIKNKKISMHRFIMNATDSTIHIDHINGNTFDNRRTNLRFASRSQNAINAQKTSNPKSSIYKGVSYFKLSKKWKAQIMLNKKSIYLGLFINEKEAALAYNKEAKALFGEFAVLNDVS